MLGFLAPVADLAGGLLGGGKPGSSAPVRQNQDGNTLRSGTGDVSTGLPKWAVVAVVVGVVVVVVGLAYWLEKGGKCNS